MKVLGPIGIAAFERRKISPELAVRFEIYTGKSEGGHVVPDERGNIIAFPFYEHGAVVNEKYRAPGKKFWQWPREKARQVFWNADVLDDPALENGSQALIITEGELDALTAVECGWPFAVSVPAGAPPARLREADDTVVPIDPETERTGRYEFLYNHRDRIRRIRRFVIAVDNDGPGQQLAAELVRRLTAAKCYHVEYPAGCKDLNDVLMAHGPEAVTSVLNTAKPYPVRGLYRLSDYPAEARALNAVTTGWPLLDPHLKIIPGEFMVVTGIPSHGKSSWALHLLCNLALLHEWRAVIFSPEMPTVPYLRDRLRRILESQDSDPDAVINYFFRFISADPTGRLDEDFDLEFIIDKATDAVLRDGVQVLLLDPWNEVEHARGKYESVTDYIGRAIRALKRFARLYNVTVIVVCHPTKEVGREGKSRRPTLYDCDGCYSDDTEVLTRRGWLHHGQVTMSDDVACFDPKTGTVEYHTPERIIRREHNGKMFRFKGYGYDLLVTPDHRMLVKPKWEEPSGIISGSEGRPVSFPKDRWTFCEARHIPRSIFAIPLAGRPIAGADPKTVVIGRRSYPAELFWRLVGWFVAEGHIGPTGLTWAQAEGELADAFSATFEQLGIPATLGWQQPSGKGKLVTGRWYIGNRFCPDLVSWFRANCGAGAANKQIPAAVFELSPRLKHVFLQGYLEGDGAKKREAFAAVTVSVKLRDQLQRLCVELGLPTSYCTRRPPDARHQTSFQISVGRPERKEVALRIARNLTRENYSGLVWCLTVPTGAYFVRRNGRVAVSGNSAHWFNKPDHGVIIHRPDDGTTNAAIHIDKSRFEQGGERGKVTMRYDRTTCRFEPLDQLL